MHRLGYSGSSKPLSRAQIVWLDHYFARLAKRFDTVELHHGDCINGDTVAHWLGVMYDFHIVVHPPNISEGRSYCLGNVNLPPRDRMDRNQDIVDAVTELVSTPEGPEDSYPYSGSWATIRRARKSGIIPRIKFP